MMASDDFDEEEEELSLPMSMNSNMNFNSSTSSSIPDPLLSLSLAPSTTTATPSIPTGTTQHRQGQNQIHSAASKNVPAFLNKLYNMVSDPMSSEFIRWSDDGQAFIGKY
jgi:hypothetical protein